MRFRSGFTLIEVVIASTVLVIALFGIMAAAFNTYSKSDVGDEYATAALLAAERIDYFRAQRKPYMAAGGTWYAPPGNPKLDVDLNENAALHVIVNREPTLLVREYVAALSEKRFADAVRDTGKVGQNQRNASAASIVEAAARRINWIPDTPDTIPAGLPNAGERISGILPNSDLIEAASVTPVVKVTAATSKAGGTKDYFFLRAPRCNDVLELNPAATNPATSGLKMRGAQISDVPKVVRYIREVWIQTNHPLGFPFSTATADGAPGGLPALPKFYTNNNDPVGGQQLIGGQANPTYAEIPEKIIARAASSTAAASGASTSRIPQWVVAVTVRVFRRDATVGTIRPDSTAIVDATRDGPRKAGLGYDPARPLATMIGYFGLRRFLQ